NIYTFAGNKIMINLITPLDVIVKNKGEYIGNYARDKAEQFREQGLADAYVEKPAMLSAYFRSMGFDL
ncbi:MAG: hypothetical protein J6C30_07140, partial [Lentisphaeria bacterium]|nr:hypothetical protein [Lentisphaeria bacterium]